MSLESKIEALTSQVAKLTEIMTFLVSNPPTAMYTPSAAVGEQPAEIVEQSKAEPVKTVSADDVTGLCLSLSRKDPSNKAKIKELLSSYKASKVSDLSESQLAEFASKLEQL